MKAQPTKSRIKQTNQSGNGIPLHLNKDENAAIAHLRTDLESFLPHGTLRIVLFGSKARGDDDHDSDIDLAIIVSGLNHGLKKQILDAVADIEIEFLTPISALVLSEEMFEHLRKRERRIALDIENEGIPV